MNSRSSTVTRYAAIVAIVFIGIAIDSALTAVSGTISAAIATLLCVLPFTQIFGYRESLAACVTFGVLSMIRAYAVPTVTSVAFMRIEVAIIPRLLISLTGYFSYKWLNSIFKKSSREWVKKYLASGISAGIGMLTNTVFVLLGITIGGNGNVLDKVVQVFVAGYAFVELGVSVVVVPMITARLSRIFALKRSED